MYIFSLTFCRFCCIFWEALKSRNEYTSTRSRHFHIANQRSMWFHLDLIKINLENDFQILSLLS